ncbi:MAG: hypothetical protein KAG20_02460 [Cocleimonas sp.]|nr:hypothetical protein [Cocleimonas sp.]
MMSVLYEFSKDEVTPLSILIIADEAKLQVVKIRHTIMQLMRSKSTAVGFLLLNSTNPLVTDTHYENSISSLCKSNNQCSSGYLIDKNIRQRAQKRLTFVVQKNLSGVSFKKGINLGYMN